MNQRVVKHIKIKEFVMQTHAGASNVDVTACGWVNPPKERLVPEGQEPDCEMCLLKRRNASNT